MHQAVCQDDSLTLKSWTKGTCIEEPKQFDQVGVNCNLVYDVCDEEKDVNGLR